MATQFAPLWSHRFHCTANVGGGDPVHVPFVVVSVWPSTGVPDTTGSEVFTGAWLIVHV